MHIYRSTCCMHALHRSLRISVHACEVRFNEIPTCGQMVQIVDPY